MEGCQGWRLALKWRAAHMNQVLLLASSVGRAHEGMHPRSNLVEGTWGVAVLIGIKSDSWLAQSVEHRK
jgi:hypothetical protein